MAAGGEGMDAAASGTTRVRGSALAPMRVPIFRRIWTASLFSNFGHLILGVGAAWEMTQMTSSPSMVALVQSALMLPLMLVALPAGAVADMFDRRRIALLGLGFSVVSGALLATASLFGLLSPWLLLLFCVLIGAGVALYNPAWQASISEQVSDQHLPAAVALGTISYNVARSIGPAIGGIVVVAAGATAAFGINATFYIPLWLAFFFWRRQHTPSRLPPERIDRAIVSGGRYALNSPPIRTVLVRGFVFGLASASSLALAPLVAKELLGGDAATYGIMLGASGMGAVLGALFLAPLRESLSNEAVVRICTVVTAIALAVVGLSRSLPLTCAAMFAYGACNITMFAMLNVSVQLTAPRWVTARALSLYSSALTGGFAIGAWGWGTAAGAWGLTDAMVGSGIVVLLTLVLGWLLPLPRGAEDEDTSSVKLGSDPEVALALTMRSGPVEIEVEYFVDPAEARAFYDAIRKVRGVRMRNGGSAWSISRDIADPSLWVERYHCPTWGDYLRMRDRYTHADFDLQTEVDAFNRDDRPRRVRRRLERPFGSVRWKADSPDPGAGHVGYLGP
jgi:predicted MFS family arabinose efflux permease